MKTSLPQDVKGEIQKKKRTFLSILKFQTFPILKEIIPQSQDCCFFLVPANQAYLKSVRKFNLTQRTKIEGDQ